MKYLEGDFSLAQAFPHLGPPSLLSLPSWEWGG